jgi:hypothetical protein
MTQPTVACNAAAANRLSSLQSAISSVVLSDTSFETSSDLFQRSLDAQALASVTTEYVVEVFDRAGFPDTPGGAGPLHIWRERWRCRLDVTTVVALDAQNALCGCAQFGS